MAKAEVSSQQQFSGPQESCGVAGGFSIDGSSISPIIPRLQERLQHRGQDSAGIAVYDRHSERIVGYKAPGLVRDVFPQNFDYAAHGLVSDIGIGHNRYGTSGGSAKDSAHGIQPLVVEWEGRQIALAFNGNLPDQEREKLRAKIPSSMPRSGHFDTNDLGDAIVSAPGHEIEEKMQTALEGIPGAYSVTVLAEGAIYGLKGPSGTWPLMLGESDNRVLLASETIVDPSSDVRWSSVHAGELVKISSNGVVRHQLLTPRETLNQCSLHDYYTAHPDSMMTEKLSFRDFRELNGRQLAKESPQDADLYIGIPKTGMQHAIGYANELGVVLTDVVNTNGDLRSYIEPNAEATDLVILNKFPQIDADLVRGKRIVLIDDSVIKSATSRRITAMFRNAGAAEIHLKSAAPKIIRGCDMGMLTQEERLIALERGYADSYRIRSDEEIADLIGVDSIHFLSQEGLASVYKSIDRSPCVGCMSGIHPFYDGEKNAKTIFLMPHVDNSARVARINTRGSSYGS